MFSLGNCSCDLSHAKDFLLYATSISLGVSFLLESFSLIFHTFLRKYLSVLASLIFRFQLIYTKLHRVKGNFLITKLKNGSHVAVDIPTYRKYQLEQMCIYCNIIERELSIKSSRNSFRRTLGSRLNFWSRFPVFIWTTIILVVYSMNNLEQCITYVNNTLPLWLNVLILKFFPCYPYVLFLVFYIFYFILKVSYIPLYKGCFVYTRILIAYGGTIPPTIAIDSRLKKNYISLYYYLAAKKIKRGWRNSAEALLLNGKYLI